MEQGSYVICGPELETTKLAVLQEPGCDSAFSVVGIMNAALLNTVQTRCPLAARHSETSQLLSVTAAATPNSFPQGSSFVLVVT